MRNNRLAFFEKKLNMMKEALTKSERRIAEYICENPEDFTKMSITELSEKNRYKRGSDHPVYKKNGI